MIEIATFVCSICGETSTDICVYCTKDTCTNHRCLRCLRCSDCCECEVPLTAGGPDDEPASPPVHAEPVPEPMPQPEPIAEVEPEPVAAAEPGSVPDAEPGSVRDAEPGSVRDAEPQPEIPCVAAVVLPEPEAVPTVEQATTQEELVRALPELFAPEAEASQSKASEAPEENAHRPEPESDDKG